MDAKRQIQKLLREKWASYCESSSLHGFVHLSTRLVIAWLLIIAACFGLCIFLWHMIWHKFVTDPTFTVVESTHYLTTGVPLPSITICDTEPVYGPRTSNITNILKSRNFNDEQIATFYRSFKNMRQANYVPEPYLRKMYSVLNDLSLSVEQFFNMTRKPCERLLVDCWWRSSRQPCSNMFRVVVALVGHCCSFDIQYFRAHAENGTNFVVGTDINEALEITINSEAILYDKSVQNSNALLYIFESSATELLLDGGEVLTPGSHYEVNLDVWLIDSSPDVKSLTLPERKCTVHEDKFEGPNCMNELVLNNIIKSCQCIPFSYRAEDALMSEYSPCGWDRLLCAYQSLEREKTNIRGTISMNKCYEKCDYVQYDTRVEYLRNCNSAQRRYTNTTMTLKFAASTCIKYRREVLYTWDQMLANLGGVFGLCLGGSIISIIELIWYIGDIFYSIVLIKNQRIEEISSKSRNVFTISQREMKKRKKKQNYMQPYSKFNPVPFVH